MMLKAPGDAPYLGDAHVQNEHPACSFLGSCFKKAVRSNNRRHSNSGTGGEQTAGVSVMGAQPLHRTTSNSPSAYSLTAGQTDTLLFRTAVISWYDLSGISFTEGGGLMHPYPRMSVMFKQD